MPVLEEAVRRFGAQVDIQWHAYELRPEPVPLPDPDGDYIAEHWRNRVLPMAEERGLVMRRPRRQIRSRRALQAALFACEHRRFRELDALLFRARFEHDADISDITVLKSLAADAGLDADALAYAVMSNSYVDALQQDIALAYRFGVDGVPAMFVGPCPQPAVPRSSSERPRASRVAEPSEDEDTAAFLADAEPVVGAVPLDWLSSAIERALNADRSVAEQRKRFRARWKIG